MIFGYSGIEHFLITWNWKVGDLQLSNLENKFF